MWDTFGVFLVLHNQVGFILTACFWQTRPSNHKNLQTDNKSGSGSLVLDFFLQKISDSETIGKNVDAPLYLMEKNSSFRGVHLKILRLASSSNYQNLLNKHALLPKTIVKNVWTQLQNSRLKVGIFSLCQSRPRLLSGSSLKTYH